MNVDDAQRFAITILVGFIAAPAVLTFTVACFELRRWYATRSQRARIERSNGTAPGSTGATEPTDKAVRATCCEVEVPRAD
jgi:hypothetical protein